MQKKKYMPPQYAEEISDFLKLMDRAVSDYKWCYDEVNRRDLLTNDQLHALELNDLKYSERAKLATKIAASRKTRRECKDTVEILDPLVSFLLSEKGKSMLGLMREALGKTRKVEERMKTRRYFQRVCDEGDEEEEK